MKTFSIFTLNVRHGQGPAVAGENRSWYWFGRRAAMRRNAQALGEFLKHMSPQPDIVCLQETNAVAFFWPDITEIVRKSAGYPHRAAASARVLPHNNAIVSRFPIARVLSRQFRKLPVIAAGWRGIYYSINRGFVAAEIEGVGTVVSTHLDPYVPALRLAQARELRAALPESGVMIAGDFNPMAWDEESLRVTSEGLATMPPIEAERFISFATWPVGRVSSKIVPEHRLDYAFVSPDFRVIAAERVLTGHTDHYGVIVTAEKRSP